MKILTIVPALSLWFVGSLQAQDPAIAAATPPSAPPMLSAAELEKLAMPIALHPDPLIATILPASVYVVEIVQAARFVKDTNNIPKIDDQPWDENVKAVAKFPELIAKMDSDLAWTVQLGQAFLDQPKELMDTIQSLRAKAQNAGTLQNTPQQIVVVTNTYVEKTVESQIVVVTNTIIQIQPVNPQVIYVPTYPYTVYYPPPAYVYNPYAPLITFGVGVAVGAIWANNCNWRYGGVYTRHYGYSHANVNVNVNRNVNINDNRNININDNRNSNRNPRPTQYGVGGDQKWQPDQNRLRTSGSTSSPQTREARGWGSGASQPSTGAVGTRPSTGTAATRPSTGTVGTGPSTGTATTRPSTSAVGTRPTTGTGGGQPSTGAVGARPSTGTAAGNRPGGTTASSRPASSPAASPYSNRASPGGSAFGDMSSGPGARNSENRGATSRGGSGRGGGRR